MLQYFVIQQKNASNLINFGCFILFYLVFDKKNAMLLYW